MFGKKKNEPVENWADRKMRELYDELGEARSTLWKKQNKPISKIN